MEVVVFVACGALAWVACFVATGSGASDGSVVVARLQSLRRAVRKAIAFASGARVVDVALRWDAFASTAREVERWSMRLPKPLAYRESAALQLVLMIAACLLGGFVAQSLLGCLVLALVAIVGMQTRGNALRRFVRMELAHGMPGVLRTLATALGSGHTLVQAMEYVGLHERGLVAEPFARTSLRLRCGMSVEAALSALEKELDAPGVDLLVTALAISQRTGSPLRELFQRSALLVEEHEGRERLLAVKTAQVRLSVRIVCCLPPLMVCVLSLISPDFRQGLLTTPGIVCIVLAAAMDGVALLVIRRILEGVV